MPTSPLLEIVDLHRTFTEAGVERRILNGANATIHRGEIAVLLGRSGSGKSTVLNLIAGIDRPTAGDVRLDGVSLGALSERDRTILRRERMGFVFQSFNLLPTLTVSENLLLPLELARRFTPERRRAAFELLAEVGLSDRTTAYPDRLSGGEQQRLTVARALAHDPDLVLADEPTGNLDLENGLVVVRLLDRLTRQLGKTLVMVTHAAEVAGVADRVFRIEQGLLVELPKAVPSPADRADAA
jgi:putative ABC transport system ATP-binding protein